MPRIMETVAVIGGLALVFTAEVVAISANGTGTISMPIQRDYARVEGASPAVRRHLAKRGNMDLLVETLTWSHQLYYINITLGTPGQSLAVQLDTGSSDLWVPDISASICSDGCPLGGFDPSHSSTYVETSKNGFMNQYGSGNASGSFGNDTLQMAGSINLENVIIAVADQGYNERFGIMGVGYDTDEGVVSQGGQSHPNVLDRLLESGAIDTRTFSLYLDDRGNFPTQHQGLCADFIDDGQGSIIFGGYDTAKFTPPLSLLYIQPNAQDNQYDSYTVAWTGLSFNVGQQTATAVTLGQGAGVPALLDSGTTLTVLENEIAYDIWEGLGLANDGSTAWAACDADFSAYSFTFTFGGTDGVAVSVSLDQFMDPYDATLQLTDTDGQPSCRFGIVPIGNEPFNILGDNFLRSVYVFYDLDNYVVGLAPTIFNVSESNVIAVTAASGSDTGTTALPSIPSAVVINNQVSVLYDVAASALRTAGADGYAGFATPVAKNPSISTPAATFKGVTSTAGPSNSKSAASSLRPPPMEWAGVLVPGAMVLLSTLSATVLLLMR